MLLTITLVTSSYKHVLKIVKQSSAANSLVIIEQHCKSVGGRVLCIVQCILQEVLEVSNYLTTERPTTVLRKLHYGVHF